MSTGALHRGGSSPLFIYDTGGYHLIRRCLTYITFEIQSTPQLVYHSTEVTTNFILHSYVELFICTYVIYSFTVITHCILPIWLGCAPPFHVIINIYTLLHVLSCSKNFMYRKIPMKFCEPLISSIELTTPIPCSIVLSVLAAGLQKPTYVHPTYNAFLPSKQRCCLDSQEQAQKL